MQLPLNQNAYQLNNAAQYNYDTSSPQYQLIQQYSDRIRRGSDARYAEQMAMLQQAQARQAQADAQAQAALLAQQQAQPVNPYTYNPYAVYRDTPTQPDIAPEAPGFWDQVIGRAMPETLATLQGGGAAIADVVGAEGMRNYLLDRAQANYAQAQINAPRQVGRIEDIKDLDSLGTWATETFADLLPSIAGTIGTGGIGAAVAGSARAMAVPAMKKAVQEKTKEYVAKGVTKEMAEEAAKNVVRNDIKRRGAASGVFAFTAAQETGSAYNENVQTHGVDNASSLRALGTGGVSAAITAIMGIEGGIIRNLTGVALSEAKEQAAKRTLIGGILKGAFQEGGEEALQELTQVFNRQISDERVGNFTPEDLSGIVNSAAAGGLFGGPGGAFNHMTRRNPLQDPQPAPTVAEETSPITTPEQRYQSTYATIREAQLQADAELNAKYSAERAGIIEATQKAMDEIVRYGADTRDPKVITMDAKARAKKLEKANQDYIKLSAVLATIDEGYAKDKELGRKDAETRLKKANSELITDNTIAQSNQFWSDPELFAQLTKSGDQAIQYVTKQTSSLKEKANQLHDRLAAVKAQQNSANALRDSRIARALKTQEYTLKKELASNEKAQRVLNNAGSKVRKMLNKPDKDFSPQMLDAELAKIYSSAVPNTGTPGTLSDEGTYSAWDSANNIIEEDTAIMEQRIQEALQSMQQAQMNTPIDSGRTTSSTQSFFDPFADTFLQQTPPMYAPAQQMQDSFLQQAKPVEQNVMTDSFLNQAYPISSATTVMPSNMQDPFLQQAMPTSAQQPFAMPTSQYYTDLDIAQQAELTDAIARQEAGTLNQLPTDRQAIPVGPASVRPALPEVTTTGRQGPGATPETGYNAGTTNAAKQVYASIQPSLKQMKGLGRATVVADNPTQAGLNIDPTALGSYDPQTNTVYLFAENIEAAVRAKKGPNAKVSPKDIKNVAVRTLVHEGVVHYGLSLVLDPTGRRLLLQNVHVSLKDHPVYQQVLQEYPDADPMVQAEEFLARMAERQTVANLVDGNTDTDSPKHKALLNKIYNLFKRILNKLGFANVTEDDVFDLLSLSASNLAQNQTSTVLSSPLVREGEQALSVQDTSGLGFNEQQVLQDARQSARPVADKARDLLTDKNLHASTRDKFMEKFVDSLHPVRKLIEEVKAKGGNIGIGSNLYKIMQLIPNSTANQMKEVHSMYVEPLLRQIADMTPDGQDTRQTYAQVADYATALAALERNMTLGEDGVSGKGWTNAKSREVIARLQSPEMDRAVSLLQRLHDGRLQIIESNVLLPKVQTDAWRAKYKFYMPLKAWDAILSNEAPQWRNGSVRKKLSDATRQDKIGADAHGTDKALDNAVTHSILQLYDVVGFKNSVDGGRSLLELIENNPSYTDLFEIDTIYTPETPGPKKRVIDKEGNVRWKKLKTSAQEHPGKTVAIIDKHGNKVRAIIHDNGVLQAFKGENVSQLQGPMKTIATIRRTLGMLFTTYNPTFWLRNPIRDAMTATLNISHVANELQRFGVPSSGQMAQAIVKNGLMRMLSNSGVTRALYHASMNGGIVDTKKIKDPATIDYMRHYDAFRQYGAQSAYFSTGGYDQANIDVLKELQDMKPNSKAQEAMAKTRALGKHMEAISDALENQTRYIAFVEIVRALEANGKNSDGSDMTQEQIYSRAANIALNLTVNFSRKGTAAPVMDALWMFSSANIAGNARLLETILRKDKDTGKLDKRFMAKFLTYPVIAYATQAMIARALMPEDEDGINMYDKIPSYVKSNNIIIPTMDGSYITIPIAYGLNVFWNMGRNIVDAVYAESTGNLGPSATEAASSIISAGFDNFSPMGSITNEGLTAFVPTIFRPLIQLNTNENFAGNPIYPDGQSYNAGDYPDSQKAWASTGPVYKMIAENLNELFGGSATRSSGFMDVSPESIEHMMNAYLGGAGRLVGQMANDLVKFTSGDYSSTDFMKAPGVSAFVRSPQPGDTTAIYMNLRTELQTQINTVEEARTNPSLSTQEKVSIIRANQAGIRMKSELGRAQKQIGDIRARERAIGNNANLSDAAKRKQLEQLQKRRLSIMMRVNKRAMELGVR